ncbi:CHAP domain-containing protein [Sphingomonas sp.]|uniref:CHAP domain-containing protein n=1 Tax=Sphingomonas sp. TaxID=28214 RepID=UPI001EBBCA8D|nr:CHAP domain-containing protein [Sphingomonas sp.]MBX3593034.1 CHAP domain-containing protein [Sphingomonas sp.]
MKIQTLGARFALMAALCLATIAPAQAQFWQCVPYARMVSGIEIYGNALTWWSQAEGKYERGREPVAGSVMSFAPTARMKLGHVAMVSKVISDREVLLTHANWSRRGGVEKNVIAIDVSDKGDWSRVKVWFAGNNGLGSSVYPVNGFIYADGAPEPGVQGDGPLAPLTIAQVDLSKFGVEVSLQK